jgi:hypothetical protein
MKFRTYISVLLTGAFLLFYSCDLFKKKDEEVPGCTDPLSDDYNPAATVDDGSCTYSIGNFAPEGKYSNTSGNNPSTQITQIPALTYQGIQSKIVNNRACIEVLGVQITDNGVHHEITHLEMQEKRNGEYTKDASFESYFTETTRVGIVLLLQQSIRSDISSAGDEAKYSTLKSYAQDVVSNLKAKADHAKASNSNSRQDYYISIVGYGSKDSISVAAFPGTPLNTTTQTTINQYISNLPRKANQFAALGQALQYAVNQFSTLSVPVDYRCILIIGDGKENDSDGQLTPAIDALKASNVDGVYCIGVLESNYSTLQGGGEQNFIDLSKVVEDGMHRNAKIVEETKPVFNKLYNNIPNTYNLKYERSPQSTTGQIDIRWVLTTKKKQ